MIGLHFDGRPISDDAADESLNAILECWNPAAYATEAVTDALLGRLNPSGKMPVSTAYCAGVLQHAQRLHVDPGPQHWLRGL